MKRFLMMSVMVLMVAGGCKLLDSIKSKSRGFEIKSEKDKTYKMPFELSVGGSTRGR